MVLEVDVFLMVFAEVAEIVDPGIDDPLLFKDIGNLENILERLKLSANLVTKPYPNHVVENIKDGILI